MALSGPEKQTWDNYEAELADIAEATQPLINKAEKKAERKQWRKDVLAERRTKRIIAAMATLAVGAGITAGIIHTVNVNDKDHHQDKVKAVAEVLRSPADLAALGICPSDLEREARLLPAEAAQYAEAAAVERVAEPTCTDKTVLYSLTVGLPSGDYVDVSAPDLLPR